MNHLEILLPTLTTIANKFEHAIGSNFIGFYVAGSLTMNAWNPETSDIDFLIVTKESLNEKESVRVSQTRDELASSDEAAIYEKLEGQIIPLHDLRNLKLSAENTRSFIEHGVTVLGTKFNELGISVSEKDFKDAVYNMLKEAKEEIHQSNSLEHKMKILVNTCRCIYSLETGKLPTKAGAVEYCKHHLGDLYDHAKNNIASRAVLIISDETVLSLVTHGLTLWEH